MTIPRFLSCLVIFATAWPQAGATVALAPLFGTNMVLQRGKPVPVTGTAAPNKTITVGFNTQSKTTTSDAAGNWLVTLDPMAAKTTGGDLTANEAGANTVTLTNVVVGDVWICSGQSNMAWNLGSCNRQTEDVSTANYPVMRTFSAPLANLGEPTKSITGSWTVCSPSTAANFSAVAFYFGRKICQDQSSAIPIGLFVTSVGGTCIDPWLAPEGCTDIPVIAPLYSQSILPWGPFSLFNGMVYPYAPLPAKGAIWYQGENRETTSQSTDSYYLKEKALQQGWQRLLGLDDFPLYVVQIANWLDITTSVIPDTGTSWADTRVQQTNVLGLPHAGVAVTIDVGEAADIHPKDKLDVGERLALWALKNDYGRTSVVPSGPILRDVTASGNKITCSFDYVGGGLMCGFKNGYAATQNLSGGSLQRFSIAGADGVWYAGTAVINGGTVEVTSPSVASPKKVAYACWTNPAVAVATPQTQGMLYNIEGLPASPFYVDDVTAKYTITASTGSNGSISPAGATSYLKRMTALYTITPDSGYYIQDVMVDGVSVGAVKSYSFDPLYANHTITATFAASPPNFTVTATASAGGTITPSGAVSLAQGAGQSFTITPTGGAITTLALDGKPMGQRTSITVADVRTNHTVAATFSFPLNAQAGYGGTITPAGSTLAAYGSNQTYTITPLSGFAISKVTVDGVNVGNAGTYSFTNVTSSHAITATFTGTGGSGSIPQTGQIYCSFLTDTLPASGNVSTWASYLPAGKTLTAQNSPSVEVIDGRKFVKNVYNDYDCLNLGTIASPIPCTGATIVTVAKPTRFGTDGNWYSIVDFFYDRLVLGIMSGSGRVCVRRNGSLEFSTAAIPDGQTTILSLIVQQDGTYKVYANGTQVMNVTSTSSMTSIVPGVAGGFANNVTFGRNWPDGWTTYNGYYGDSFVYTTALYDTERQQLETYLVNRLTASGTTYTITSSAGTGGSISPAGSVIVNAGANQTFNITPNSGYAISGVTVDGSSVGAVASYTFNSVAANHTIAATFTGSGTTYTITASAGTGGSISPTGAVTVNSGASQTFNITPDSGYAVSGVTVDAGSVGAVTSYTFNNVTANHTIAATFAVMANTPPTISSVVNQNITPNSSTATLAFTIGDTETPTADLTVAAVSSNTTLVPDADVVLGGSGANRTVTVTPAANQTGTTTITLTVSDGTLTTPSTFTVTVAAAGATRVISVNVGGFDTAHDVTGSLGAVDAGNWNNLTTVANAVGTNLMDDTGAATTMDISFSGWNKDTFNAWGDMRADMFSNFLHHQGDTMSNATVILTQIPYATYDVYIYYTGFVSKQVQAWTDGSTTIYGLRGPSSGGGLSGYVPYQTTSEATALADAAGGTAGGNYLKFTGLTVSGVTLTSLGLPAQAGFEQDGIAGIQIVNTTPANTYASWIAGFPAVGTATGFSDDPDGDGIKNGLENYLGTDPSQASAGLTQASATGSTLKFRHTRSNNIATDVTAAYQWSADLANWYASGQTTGEGLSATIAGTVITDTNAPDNDVIEVTVTVSGGSNTRVFARILATQTP